MAEEQVTTTEETTTAPAGAFQEFAEPSTPDFIEPNETDETEVEETEVTVEPTTEESEAESGEKVEGVIDESALQLAETLGISREDAESFGSTPALMKALTLIAKRGPGAGQTQEKKPDESVTEPAKDFELDLDEDEHSPEFISKMKGMAKFYNDKIAEMRGTVDALVGHIQAQQTQAQEERFDSRVEKLDESYRELFGTGRSVDMDTKSPEFKNRLAVWNEMRSLIAGYRSTGQPIPSEDALFKKALASRFSEKAAALARGQVRRSLESQRGSAVGRPTGHRGKIEAEDPTARAYKAVQEKLKQFST